MKKLLIIILCLAYAANNTSSAQENDCKTCLEFKLMLNDKMLIGTSKQFAGIVSFSLPARFTPDSLTSDYIFSAVRDHDIRGKLVIPKVDSTEIKYLLLPYKDTVAVFMQIPTGLWPWVSMRIENDTLIFSCDIFYSPPPEKIDLEIIDLCLDYLKDPSSWNRNDDRNCDRDDANKTWSLYCALKNAFVEKMGYFNYRGAVLEISRMVIKELVPDKVYGHPLLNYNNDPETGHSDILNLLYLVRARIEAELNYQD